MPKKLKPRLADMLQLEIKSMTPGQLQRFRAELAKTLPVAIAQAGAQARGEKTKEESKNDNDD